MTLLADVRFAAATVRARPGVPVVVTALFALSVGLAGGLWAVVDAVALRPLPFPQAHQLVAIMESHPERGLLSVTAANFWDWSTRVRSLSHVVGLGSLESSLVVGADATRVVGTKVTDGFFDVVGIAPALGRAFTEADVRSEPLPVVVSHGLWQRTLGGVADVVGRSVLLDGMNYVVVGVMPPTFKSIGPSDVWVPWVMSAEERAERRFHMVGVMGRLAPGRTAAEAERELRAEYHTLEAAYPATTARWTGRVIPVRDLLLGDSGRALLVLGTAVVALVVVAAVNVVGLLLAWLRQRRRELIVRLALGATVGRLVRHLVVDVLLWGTAGVAGGVALAFAFVRLFGAVGVSSALEFDFEPRVNGRVVMAMVALMGVLTLATAVVPAWLSARRVRDLTPKRAAASGRWGQRLAIAAQVAVSLALLCGAATLVDGFQRVEAVAGRRSPGLMASDISLTEAGYPTEASQAAFFERLLRALTTRPEVARVAVASYIPPSRIFGNVRFAIEGREGDTEAQTALASAVDAGALGLLGVTVVEGRAIVDRDDRESPRVAVISAALARRYWPNGDAIGRRLTVAGTSAPATIVGIVSDVRQPLGQDPRTESLLYLPYRQVPWPFMTVMVEPREGAAPAIAALREELARLDPVQATGPARPLDELQREWLTQPRLRSRIAALFGLSAALLTVVGLWARVSYGVASRTKELAIRHALGAGPMAIVTSAVGEVAAVTLVGAAAGVLVWRTFSQLVQSAIPGLPPPNVELLALTTLSFIAVAMLSALLPTRSALGTSPAQTLQAE